MNIHEISRRAGVPVNRLRALEKLGVLVVDKANEQTEQIRRALWRQSQLSLAQLDALLNDPGIFDDLGSRAVQERAQSQIDALGDLSTGAATARVAINVPDAHKSSPVALRELREYVESVAPPFGRSISFHWIGIRILRAAPPGMREAVASSLNIALAKVRALPEFAGWFTKDPDGKIRYHQPVKHDL